MTYSDERPFFDANCFPETEPGLKLMRSVLSTKSKNWAYEAEYRTFVDLKDTRVRRAANGDLFWPIPSGCLKHVVIGAMSAVSIMQVEQALRIGGIDGATVSKARLCDSEFKVVV